MLYFRRQKGNEPYQLKYFIHIIAINMIFIFGLFIR